jgi:hypothetical protein
MHRNGDLDEASLDTAASVDSMITNIVVRKNEGEIIEGDFEVLIEKYEKIL